MQGGCNTNMRFNQKFMFRKDRGIDFSFWLGWKYAPDAMGFPPFRPLYGKRSLSDASTAVENQTFGARRDKKLITVSEFVVVMLPSR